VTPGERPFERPSEKDGDSWWPFDEPRTEDLPSALSRRVEADPENVEKGLVQLVLTLVELLRQLMERQAIRRVEAGGLDEEEVERLGRTLMLLEQRMEELREHFGLTLEDLNLDLGPLGRLL
jgi:hypothetical protein